MRRFSGLLLVAILAIFVLAPPVVSASEDLGWPVTCTGQVAAATEIAASFAASATSPASTDILAYDMEYVSDGVSIRSYVSRPARAGKHPAIVVIHSVVGLAPDIKEFAQDLAREGFVALAIGWHTREIDPPDAILMKDIANGLKWLGAQEFVDAQRVAITGFCRGGTVVFLALSQIEGFKAGIAFYGFPFYGALDEKKPVQPYDLAEGIRAPLLMLHGHSDTAARVGNIYRYTDRLGELGKEFQLKVYSGMGHGFFNKGNRNYNPEAAADAWKEAISFLKKYLPAMTWEEQFRTAQGRDPSAQDMADRVWAAEFLAQTGRLPGNEDWERHYYQTRK